MGKINVLGFDVANLIAAGEVVDRPASVVKELLENSIDAGATSVTVEIQNGGVTLIRVTDNGCGMEPDDLPVAILRHATSKIKTSTDLSNIGTLGFRGEALAAIASVSRLRIFSRPAANEMGTLLECEAGKVTAVSEVGCAAGTTVVVEDLFYSVPARRKFLKRDATEAAAASAVVERIALSRPDIEIRFLSDGDMKFVTTGSGDLKEAVYSVFGRECANRSVPVDRTDDGVAVSGFISEPDLYKSNRNMEVIFVNGRLVKSRTIMAAVEQAYKTRIPSDKFPVCVLNVGVSVAAVDVNVHPAKLEVKFSNEKIIFDAVYYAVLGALQSAVARPELKIRGLEAFDDIPCEGGSPAPAPAKPAAPRDGFWIDGDEAKRLLSAFVPADVKRKREEQIRVGSVPTEEREAAAPPRREEETAQTEENFPVGDPGPVDPPEYVILGEAYNCYVIVQFEDRITFVYKHAAHERIFFDEMCRNARRAEKSAQLLVTPLSLSLPGYEGEALKDYEDEIKSLGFDFSYADDGTGFSVSVTAIPEQLNVSEAKELLTTLVSKIADSTASVASASAEFFESRLFQSACKAAIKGGRRYGIDHIKWICDRLFVKNPGGSVIRTCPHGRPVAFEIKRSSIDRQFGRLD